ncbi:DUF3277 family protein [Paenibacillus albiflavus]|uniref:DUF3277 family protein n=1 Tax=Paenibacillus albiflavus TaxID=2545760 RepID=A0A4R4EDT1_9BACL|nr:phage protein [Paenibacillus albiflavus]TCZ76178.1 DUF3277 family protein [Paenibacillus albiflavus]
MAKVYDPKNTTVIVGGVYLTGLGEDMVEVDKDEDNQEAKVGAQGDVAVARINNNLGTIKVTLLSVSPQVSMLDRLANSGKLFPISVIYAGDPKETATATEAFVKKPATRSYGKEVADREYEIQALDLKFE